jgi:protein-ribulosamine 3-kinase
VAGNIRYCTPFFYQIFYFNDGSRQQVLALERRVAVTTIPFIESESLGTAITRLSGVKLTAQAVHETGTLPIGYRGLVGGEEGLFLKVAARQWADALLAEAAGLAALAVAIRVPHAWGVVADKQRAILLLEPLPLVAHGSSSALGSALAVLHRHTADHFGWSRDNLLGAARQHNGWHSGWSPFFARQRIGRQLEAIARQGGDRRLVAAGLRLQAGVDRLLDGHQPQPSLLHGDLWSGNYGFLTGGVPVLFDPACYYGDRECDIAMSELFGGFSADFYAAYREAWPLDSGYGLRRQLYNLYHLLNHYQLFGGHYGQQAYRVIQQLLAEGAG